MKVCVTGAGGFLGSVIVKKLLERGDQVKGIARSNYPELTALGAEMIRGDISCYQSVSQAVNGCDAVIHVAAKAGVWGAYKDYYTANVVGTDNMIRACQENHITRLVYTSTPSVVYDGEDENGVDETAPYASNFLCHYARTKAQAEKNILSANNADLATVALRPHIIWGPGDPHLIPRIVDRSRAGRMIMIGKEDKLVDTIYVDNAADAHLLALDSLDVNSPLAGKAYFLSNDEPILMIDMLNKVLEAAGVAPLQKRIPSSVAYCAGALLELIYTVLKRENEPLITRFVAKQLSTAHWFRIDAAKQDFSYHPKVSIEEGIKRLRDSFHQSDC